MLLGILAFGIKFRGRSFVAGEYVLVVLSLAFYTLPYAAELASVTLDGKSFFHRIVWIGVAATPSSVALLALRYARRRVARGLLFVLGLVPVIMLALEWTNDAHHWLEGPASLVSYGDFTMRLQRGEIAYWIFLPFAYLCVFGALAIYGAAWLSGPPIQQRQARALPPGDPRLARAAHAVAHRRSAGAFRTSTASATSRTRPAASPGWGRSKESSPQARRSSRASTTPSTASSAWMGRGASSPLDLRFRVSNPSFIVLPMTRIRVCASWTAPRSRTSHQLNSSALVPYFSEMRSTP